MNEGQGVISVTTVKQGLWVLGAVLMAACGTQAPKETVTYWGNVAPLVNAKCATCHQAGGIGPFALDTYAAVRDHAADMAAAASAGTMPPYLLAHDGTCGQFNAAESLSADEVSLLGAWAASKREEGKVAAVPLPSTPGLQGAVSVQTPSIVPVAQGGQLAESDEYRCFRATPTLTKSSFITAYEVLPGNAALVHHVLGFVVDPNRKTRSGKTNQEVMQALDDADADRVGWPCFGVAGDGVEVDSVPISWGPGQGKVVYPEGLGVLQRATDVLILQVHYNLESPVVRGQSDSTTVKLRYADSVPRQAAFLFYDPLLETLFGPEPKVIPPGAASTRLSFTNTGAQLGFGAEPYDLVGVLPHMHTRGKKSLLEVKQQGKSECLAKVDRWDFHWQKFYFYEGTLPQLNAESELTLTCDYDTAGDTAPVLPGWGTRNEMCLAILMIAPHTGR